MLHKKSTETDSAISYSSNFLSQKKLASLSFRALVCNQLAFQNLRPSTDKLVCMHVVQSALAATNSFLTNLASERTNQLETVILFGI